MSIQPTSPVVGAAVAAFTSPTFTLTADQSNAPNFKAKQWVVSAIGGTQPSGRAHTASDPFTLTYEAPAKYKMVNKTTQTNAIGSYMGPIPKNTHTIRVRKGAYVDSAQRVELIVAELNFRIPSGVESVDPTAIKQVLSMLAGALSVNSSAIGDTLLTNVA